MTRLLLHPTANPHTHPHTAEFARQYRRTTSLQDFVAASTLQQANDTSGHSGLSIPSRHGQVAAEPVSMCLAWQA